MQVFDLMWTMPHYPVPTEAMRFVFVFKDSEESLGELSGLLYVLFTNVSLR